jgi:transposase
MSKYSAQFKLKVVNDYLSGGGYLRVANHYGINTTDVRKWVLAHKLHGVSALQKRGYQQYTPQFKLLVLEHMRTYGASPRLAAAHFNIASSSTVLVWQRLYNEGGITALEPKPKGRPAMPKRHEIQALLAKPSSELTPEELLRKLHYLEVENAYLKKLQALAQQKYLANKNKPKSSLS